MNRRSDRRAHTRFRDMSRHGIDDLRLRSGQEARLVDVSEGGLLIETRARLLPGSRISLNLLREDRLVGVRGRVVRCTVVGVSAGELRYWGAIQFEQALGLGRDAAEGRAGAPAGGC